MKAPKSNGNANTAVTVLVLIVVGLAAALLFSISTVAPTIPNPSHSDVGHTASLDGLGLRHFAAEEDRVVGAVIEFYLA